MASHAPFDVRLAESFAAMALACVHRAYPNKIAHVLHGDDDARTPRELTPIFYGCFDWHSAVHGHWLLVRLSRLFPDADFAPRMRQALEKSFTDEGVAGELRYLTAEDRESFERPYGLAWFLQLMQELHEWQDPGAAVWRARLAPLETLCAQRLQRWLPGLARPIRTGEHNQTAFALGLVLDWARSRGETAMIELVHERAQHYYLGDRGWNLAFEPSGHDFLSPSLAEADLLRRVLPPERFATWLTAFLPGIARDGTGDWLELAVVTDKTDGKLVHLDGLNLSRAWMLEGIAEHLPPDDARLGSLLAAAAAHRESGLRSLLEQTYAGSHWLGSFATYLMSRRGLPGPAVDA